MTNQKLLEATTSCVVQCNFSCLDGCLSLVVGDDLETIRADSGRVLFAKRF